MMKLSFLTIVFFFWFNQSEKTSCLVSGKGYEGFIFNEDYEVFMSIEGQKRRYTPSTSDIERAEAILRQNLEDINKNHINQGDDYPFIHKRLRKYKRQYVGFINKNDEKVIWINFLWDNQIKKRLGEEVIFVNDGGSYFWNITVNLDQGILFNLDVNGHG